MQGKCKIVIVPMEVVLFIGGPITIVVASDVFITGTDHQLDAKWKSILHPQ
jgi:Ca2+/Na+ antiporter